MSRLFRVVRWIAMAFVLYVLFGLAGESAGLLIVSRAQNVLLNWIVYGTSLGIAVVAAVWGMRWYRRGRTLRPLTRASLLGFVAFFCWQMAVASIPDWNPAPLLAATVVCWGAAVVLLRASATSAALSNKRIQADGAPLVVE